MRRIHELRSDKASRPRMRDARDPGTPYAAHKVASGRTRDCIRSNKRHHHQKSLFQVGCIGLSVECSAARRVRAAPAPRASQARQAARAAARAAARVATPWDPSFDAMRVQKAWIAASGQSVQWVLTEYSRRSHRHSTPNVQHS